MREGVQNKPLGRQNSRYYIEGWECERKKGREREQKHQYLSSGRVKREEEQQRKRVESRKRDFFPSRALFLNGSPRDAGRRRRWKQKVWIDQLICLPMVAIFFISYVSEFRSLGSSRRRWLLFVHICLAFFSHFHSSPRVKVRVVPPARLYRLPWQKLLASWACLIWSGLSSRSGSNNKCPTLLPFNSLCK